MVDERVIDIQVYGSGLGAFGPRKFLAVEPSVSSLNPIVEAYAEVVDEHYVLRTNVKGKVTDRLGVVDPGLAEEANERLLEALLKEVEHLPEFPQGSFRFTSKYTKVNEYLSERQKS